MKDGIRRKLIEKAINVRSVVDGRSPARLLLTEGDDERVRSAAQKLHTLGVARVTLVSTEKGKFDAPFEAISVINPSTSQKITQYAEELYNLRKSKGLTLEEAQGLVKTPLGFGAMALRQKDFDAAVSGAVHTTADVFKMGAQILKTKPGVKSASSFFLMILSDGKVVTYADCGVIAYPNSEELSDIAISSADSHLKLTGEDPRVALLSFSTKGSAEHERVTLVRETLNLVQKKRPDLKVDGELQFDAAFLPDVAKRKAPDSSVAGNANVFIFPNLDAGNIAYKITERVGGAMALGPILQGLSRPWMDLSRGCSAEDIVLVSAIAILMGEA